MRELTNWSLRGNKNIIQLKGSSKRYIDQRQVNIWHIFRLKGQQPAYFYP